MTDFGQALAALHAGHLDRAAELCSRILQDRPSAPEALSLLSYIEARRGNWHQALALADQAVALRPGDVAVRFNRAQVRDQAGGMRGAELDYREVCRLDPRHVAARVNLGGVLLRDDRLSEAEQCFAQAVAIDPNIAEAHEGLGIALQRQKRSAEAVGAFRRALALAPDNAEIASNLGGALSDVSGPREALRYLKQAVAARPGSAVLWTNLAGMLMCVADWADALSAVDSALSVSPTWTPAIAFMGIICDALGRPARRRELVDFDAFLFRKLHSGAPPGFADMTAFNAALAHHAMTHPSLLRERPGKTTRNGSQTGNLVDDKPGPIAALVEVIKRAVADYLLFVPADRGVFRLSLRPRQWRVIAWATVLDSQGHQAPHHHPASWISGVYYVAVPPEVGTAPDSAGWIEFGRPISFGAGDVTPELRLIRPEEGLMLLFPSYFWHQTVPFASEHPRISIAFDIVPM